MSEEQLFEQMKMWRKWTVEFLRTIPENVVDQIPHGHNNSIRWNAGHILVGWDNTMFPAVNEERQMPNSYHLMFPRGSKLENWTEQPPSMNKLIKQLEEQDMVIFHMNHENLHMGIIKSMKQIILK